MTSQKGTIPQKLLIWYDRNRRVLPWRALPHQAANPYRIWLSEIMLQQTTVKAVIPYFEKFTARWPDVQALAAASDDEIMAAWAGLGYYTRARKLVECARLVAAQGGFPKTSADLLKLPGIGPYTSAAIAAIAFGEAATVIDGNVERVVSRLFAIETPLPKSRPEIRAYAEQLTPEKRSGDFAQAMMDLGATICTPRKPACSLCPLQSSCKAFAVGEPARFPFKLPKKQRPLRSAAAYWITHQGDVLLRKRPAKGLLGGMSEIPSQGWSADFDTARAPLPYGLTFTKCDGVVTHTFTHFDVEITVFTAEAAHRFNSDDGAFWWPLSKLDAAGLPTVMVKAVQHAQRAHTTLAKGVSLAPPKPMRVRRP